MLKNMILALMPLTLIASTVNADDSLGIDLDDINGAEVETVEANLELDLTTLDDMDDDFGIDLDALGIDDEGSEDEAIEACFRRCGYRSYGWNNCHYNHCYRPCYRPCYKPCYNYCRPVYTYRPVCHYTPICHPVATPVYSCYWGCH